MRGRCVSLDCAWGLTCDRRADLCGLHKRRTSTQPLGATVRRFLKDESEQYARRRPARRPLRQAIRSRSSRSSLSSSTSAFSNEQARGRPATRLTRWTSSDSAPFARASRTALAGEGRAAGIACASVVGVELHMHPDVGVCSIGYNELIAVLLFRQQRGHAVQPPPGLWNGRKGGVSREPRRAAPKPSAFRPSGKRVAGVGWCPLGL